VKLYLVLLTDVHGAGYGSPRVVWDEDEREALAQIWPDAPSSRTVHQANVWQLAEPRRHVIYPIDVAAPRFGKSVVNEVPVA